MSPESRFALILASIATTFCLGIVGMFSTYMFIKQESLFDDGKGFNIFSRSGGQFKGLNKAFGNR